MNSDPAVSMAKLGTSDPRKESAERGALGVGTLRDAPEIAVIGGGPAGLIAAEALATAGARVTVYDRMPSVGRKLLIAGRGGLNLTHSEPLADFAARYGVAAPHLADALAAFPPSALRRWCEDLGQPTFVGTSGRVFPAALKASPLLRAWLRRLDGLGVRFALRQRWTGWTETGALRFEDAAGLDHVVRPAATVLALGGASWPRLGSDGAWTDILASAEIRIAPLRPANGGFRVAWSEVFRSRFEGAPVKRIALAFAGRRVRGEAVVTADGIEGGAVYAVSAGLREAVAADGEATLVVDLRPDFGTEALGERLAKPRGGQSTATFLRKAAGLPPVAIGLLRECVGGPLPIAAPDLAALIKAVPLRITGLQPIARAISTAGGIALDEIDAGFMLRRRPGTFVAGEMLDWEAPTGGYLLQASFSTGVAAARGTVAWLAGAPPWAR